MKTVSGRLRQVALVVSATLSSLVGCAADERASESADSAPMDESIIHGTASSAAQDAVIMLRIGEEALCSGTLIAPNLVLTARHCVSETSEGIACAPDGRAIQGGEVGKDRAPSALTIYTGRKSQALTQAAQAVRILHDGADNLCNHDLALLLLDHPITDITPAALRLTDNTEVGETVTAVGWGLTAKDVIPSARQQRRSVPILDVGPSADTPPHDMVVGESICSGDSGGPALSRAGAVIGVVSYGGNRDPDPTRPAGSCLGSSARNTYTRIAPFATLIKSAFKTAGHTPVLEHVTK